MAAAEKSMKQAQRTLSTILTSDERLRVDAAGEGIYRSYHRQDVMQVMADIRTQRAAAILVSVRQCEEAMGSRIFRAIREVPRVPTIALLSDMTWHTAETLLVLGRQGVHQVVDVRTPSGWAKLRGLVENECVDGIEREARRRLEQIRPKITSECWKFFSVLFRDSARVSSVHRLAEAFEILPSTLMSRFFRVGLPAPKRYLAMARLVRAAYLLENSGFSVANVADHLEFSSPQSFGRHLRTVMGMTALNFRRSYTGEKMFDMFEEQLITPYRVILAAFSPLSRLPYTRAMSQNISKSNVK
ncbi:MAG: helix-turn-helix domain-containing protein [Gemmatimonadaceae bacterium]